MARRPLDPALLETLRGILRQRGHRLATVDPLPGDVSSRHYFRMLLETGGTVVLAVYPDELSAVCGRFSETAALLSSVGVRVPRILDADCDAGWMLVEDLGEQNLYQRFAGAAAPWPDLSPYYRTALTFIDRIQRVPALRSAVPLPRPDAPGTTYTDTVARSPVRSRRTFPHGGTHERRARSRI